MSPNPERYSEEQALEEASRMKNLVKQGTASDFVETEEQLMIERLKSELIRPVPPEYDRIIRDAQFVEATDPYSIEIDIDGRTDREAFSPSEEDIKNPEFLTPLGHKILEVLKDASVIDLACGEEYGRVSSLRKWSTLAHARRYIGVDLGVRDGAYMQQALEIYYLKEDMLRFMSSLPDGSADAVFLSGIEADLLGVEEAAYKYLRALKNEIQRALKKGGHFILGLNPDTGTEFSNLALRKIELQPDNHSKVRIFQKEVSTEEI